MNPLNSALTDYVKRDRRRVCWPRERRIALRSAWRDSGCKSHEIDPLVSASGCRF